MSEKKDLRTTLRRLADNRAVSFHMPGHKYGRDLFAGENLMRFDATEIEPLDDLHDAKGCIAEIERRLARFAGAAKSKLLVGGSTVGILAAILGAVPRGSRILCDRGAHKSVYHAIEMNELDAVYFFPLSQSAPEWESTLRASSDASLVVFTYPTYEGVLYDLADRIERCRRLVPNAVILVDEAHGAHFPLSDDLPSATRLGADIVVQSLHKMLPALTMTSVLHYTNTLWEGASGSPSAVDSSARLIRRVDRCLAMLQSSSPSYILMCGAEEMLDLVESEGKRRYRELTELSRYLREELDRRGLLVREPGVEEPPCRGLRRDPGKILLKTSLETVRRLREEFHIYFEMSAARDSLILLTISNRREDCDRLIEALDRIGPPSPEETAAPRLRPVCVTGRIPRRFAPPWAVRDLPTEVVSSGEALGRVASRSVVPYPPGIPVVVAGEIFGAGEIALLEERGIREYEVLREVPAFGE